MDAVRGVAALSVFTLHAFPFLAPIHLPHAYLAVDLFFMLSGFVIDHAYGNRLATDMSVGRFVVARYIRLYPLYIFGFGIGALAAGISLVAGAGNLDATGYAKAVIAGTLLLPSPTWADDAMLVPFNYPAWSLMFEIAINIVYAATWRYWRVPVLIPVAIAGALALIVVGHAYGTTGYGAYWTYGWIGGVRVVFAFVMGILIRRLWTGQARHSRWAWLAPIATLPLLYGVDGVAGELVTIILLFPLVIWLSAAIEPRGGRAFEVLGIVSYPLYVIHIPILQLVERASTVLHVQPKDYAPWPGLAIGAGVVLLALALDRWYDRPVRRWLTARLGQRPARIDRGL
ncbi:acyltransferase [Sphingomonas metalli]|uniref:Acyltransferase n=2 Tax=Sphingomonas metalli TaxID=1779358 RepID=A0A916T370_9SPHN|nr:acyltransferase [Sphingomonas metalli]